MIKFKDLVQFKRDEIERGQNSQRSEAKANPADIQKSDLDKELPSVS